MKREYRFFELWTAFFLSLSRQTGKAAAGRWSKPLEIVIPAIVIALPLWAFGFLILGWINTDDATAQRIVQQNAQDEARGVEGAIIATLDRKSQEAFARIAAVRKESNPNGLLRQLVYSGEISYVLIRRGTQLVFPPDEERDLPKREAERLQLLSVASDLYSHAEPPQGWYAGASGIDYFRCDRTERENVCLALDETAFRPDLTASIAAEAKQAPDWAFRLRDSYNRVFWENANGSLEYPFNIALSGTLRGWTLDIASVVEHRTSFAQILMLTLPLALFWIYFVWSLAKRQSEKLSQVEGKKAFLAKIAHDLRTPLANLKLYCELVAQQSEGNAIAEDHCAVLSSEIDRLDQVASNAMTFGQSRAPQTGRAIADELVQVLLERFDQRLAACKSVCTIEASEIRTLIFDRGAFERILVNLLDNACKYAPGAIAVATRFDEGLLRLEVRDHGPGLELARGAFPQDSGLGLSIVRDLAQANGGRVSMINGHDGLRVVVTLEAKLAELDHLDAARC